MSPMGRFTLEDETAGWLGIGFLVWLIFREVATGTNVFAVACISTGYYVSKTVRFSKKYLFISQQNNVF